MATVRRRTGRIWMAIFRDSHGRRRERSTGETNEADALAVAREFEAVARAARKASRLRERLAALAREAGMEVQEHSVREVCAAWMESRCLGVSASSARQYRDTVEDFLRSLGDRAGAGFDGLAAGDVERWRNGIAERTSARNANHRHAMLRMVFRSAARKGIVQRDVAADVEPLKMAQAGRTRRRGFTVEELDRVLAACPDGQWRAMVAWGADTGQRLGDIATARGEDVADGWWSLRQRKTGVVVRIPLSARAMALAGAGGPRTGALFPKAAAEVARCGGTGGLSARFARILVAAGLRGKGGGDDGKGRRRQNELVFHSLRHTFVSRLARAGVPRAVAMALAGHSTTAMHAAYTHVGEAALKEAVEKLEKNAGETDASHGNG